MYACIHAPGNLPAALQCAARFSPLIEETSADTVVFDIRGLKLIVGSPEKIASEIERTVGVAANIAIASNPDAAIHAAVGLRGVTVIPAGREAAVLAPLPAFLLAGPASQGGQAIAQQVVGQEEVERSLHLWGIRTFGEFAALPRLGVAARLGEAGTRLQTLARGEGRRQLRLRSEVAQYFEEKELEESVQLVEPLLFVVTAMAGDVFKRLRMHGRAANEVRLRLTLEWGSPHEVVLRLPVTTLDFKAALKLLQLDFNDKPPKAPVRKIRLEMSPTEPRSTQHDLFEPAAPEPEKLAVTLARVRVMTGPENAGSPELVDTHRPDSFRITTLKLGKSKAAPLPPAAFPKLGLRRYRPPHPARVACSDQGAPVRVSSSVADGPISACAGPWGTAGDWWTNQSWDSQEWDIEVRASGLFRLSQNNLKKQWLVEGSYD